MKRLDHGLPASSTPHRPVDSHPHPPLSSLSNGSFGDQENEFSYTIQKAKNFELMAMHMERWPGSRTGDFLEDGKGVPCRGRRDLDGDRNPGQGDFLAGVCRDEQVLGLRHNGLQLWGWTALVCRCHMFGDPHYIIERVSAFPGWCSFACAHYMVVAKVRHRCGPCLQDVLRTNRVFERFPVALEKFWAVRAPGGSHASGVSQLRIPLTS